jgi:predicted nucleic acid-binding protein
MSRRVHLDANVILRFLRNDDPHQAPIASELFKRGQAKQVELIASPVTLLEVFYVLASTYGQPRVAVAKILHTLVSSGLVVCEDGGIALDALQRITANKISFGDAYLAATAVRAKEEIASFDKGVAAFRDARVYPLESLAKAGRKPVS